MFVVDAIDESRGSWFALSNTDGSVAQFNSREEAEKAIQQFQTEHQGTLDFNITDMGEQ
jgi:hypothetical protein